MRKVEIFSIYFLGIAFRSIVSLYSYSGAKSAPNFGDYEAQRHWQEITVNLSPKDWYSNSSVNNMEYWGLDYPPLTAYHSFVVGKMAKSINESYVEMEYSRGLENSSHKSFMRLSVLMIDVFLYIPAIIILVLSVAQMIQLEYSLHIWLFIAVTFPGQILVDNGHFQYNNFSLGLAAFAITAILRDNFELAAFLYTLALNYKQMELYHSLPFFFYLLRVCLMEKRFCMKLHKFIRIAITVIGTTLTLWIPWMDSFNSIRTVVERLFPVGRGIFEDKVSNIWCALNVLYKIKTHFSNKDLMFFCLIVTACTAFPINIYVFNKHNKKNFLISLTSTSMAFFLLSYHVHEKSILLVSLPAISIFAFMPAEVFWFLKLATFSMFPLYVKDGLHLPFFCSLFIFHVTVRTFYLDNVVKKYKKLHIENLNEFLDNPFAIIVMSMLMLYIPPPSNYLYMWPLLIALFSCFSFILFFFFSLLLMVGLKKN